MPSKVVLRGKKEREGERNLKSRRQASVEHAPHYHANSWTYDRLRTCLPAATKVEMSHHLRHCFTCLCQPAFHLMGYRVCDGGCTTSNSNLEGRCEEHYRRGLSLKEEEGNELLHDPAGRRFWSSLVTQEVALLLAGTSSC